MTDRGRYLARSHRGANPWMAAGITVLATVLGFFLVYRWPSGSQPRVPRRPSAQPTERSAPGASAAVNAEAMLASVRAQAARPPAVR